MNAPHPLSFSALPPRAWLVVALLWVVAALNYLDRTMITTMRGSLVEAIPMTDTQFGLLTSAFLWVYAVLSPISGFLADRFNRARVIIVSLLVWSFVTWLTAHAKTFEQLMITRALMGVSEAAYIPAALALISDYHRGPTRSLATGLHMTGISIGTSLGGVGGWIAEHHTWSYSFNLFGIIGIVYSVLLIFFLRPAPVVENGESSVVVEKANLGEAIVSLFSRGSFILLIVFWGLLGFTGWALTGWLPTYLGEHFHLKQGEAGLSATGYLHIAAIFGLLIGGSWADRWSRTNERGRILVPTIGLCVAGFAVLLLATTGHLILAIAGMVLYGLSRPFTDANLMPILCQVADSRYRATGYGILNMFATLVGGLTIYLGGVMRDAKINLSNLFLGAMGCLFACAVLLFLVRPRSESKPEDASA
jgi:MFS family permease